MPYSAGLPMFTVSTNSENAILGLGSNNGQQWSSKIVGGLSLRYHSLAERANEIPDFKRKEEQMDIVKGFPLWDTSTSHLVDC